MTEEFTQEEPTQIEMTGPDVEEAIHRGLAELGLARTDVSIEILDQGRRGILGIKTRPARVRLTRLEPVEEEAAPATPTPREDTRAAVEAEAAPTPEPVYPDLEEHTLQVAQDTLMELLEKMHVSARVEVARGEADKPGDEKPILLDVYGDDLGNLIGRRGETLDALQYITRRIVARELRKAVYVHVDVEGYRARRANQLERLARRTADQVMKYKRPLPLEPMPANERRLIHIALRDHKHVYTESKGTGNQRKVTIYPR